MFSFFFSVSEALPLRLSLSLSSLPTLPTLPSEFTPTFCGVATENWGGGGGPGVAESSKTSPVSRCLATTKVSGAMGSVPTSVAAGLCSAIAGVWFSPPGRFIVAGGGAGPRRGGVWRTWPIDGPGGPTMTRYVGLWTGLWSCQKSPPRLFR